jgi:lysyl-tRNA synthetase class 1
MIWVDREVKKIKERKHKLEWVDDMKTPSGRIHVGALRGVIVHDLVFKVLKQKGVNVHYSYVFNDMDPMDAIPSYLNTKKYKRYEGVPLFQIPPPQKGAESFAQYYAQEFIDVFNSLNCHPEIIWSSQLYASGKMNDVIKIFLDNAEKVREIYKRVAKADRPKDWHPFNPLCEKCGKIGTTNVYKWDGEYVYYRCEPELVAWAAGCGYEGKVTPYNGHGKLPWKVDWAAHWKVIGVTIEGSGKDHMSAGGSYDMASTFCREVLNIEPPYAIAYEWFTIGGRKMSSSKGIGTAAGDVYKILPLEVFRFLLVRTPVNTHLDFNPYGETILNLFDDYDRCLNAYFDKLEGKIPEGKPGEVLNDFARIAELSAVRPLPKKRLFLPRFRTVVNLVKTKVDLLGHFEAQKGKPLIADEKEILEEREVFARKYLVEYIEEKETTKQPAKISLSKKQKDFLTELVNALSKQKKTDRDTIQNIIFGVLKKGNYQPREVFPAFYQVLTGQPSGPKAADLILNSGIKETVERLKKV